MPYDRIANAKIKTVGAKQTVKAIEKGLASEVVLAQDADEHVKRPIAQLCQDKGVAVSTVDSMQKLGKACGIDVRCACAAILR